MANKLYSDGYLAWFDRNGLERPSHTDHLKVEDIEKTLRKLKVRDWKLEGNKLSGETDMGPFVQTIPTDIILEGTDEDGLPKFRKVIL